jgi:hypothetical protein
MTEMEEPMMGAVSGEGAVEEAESAASMTESDRAAPVPTAPASPGSDDGNAQQGTPVLRTVGGKAFVLRDGRWIDTRYDDSMPVTTVPFGSDAYFELAGRSSEIARYLSVGVPLLVVIDGAAYEIVASDLQVDPTKEGAVGVEGHASDSATATATPVLAAMSAPVPASNENGAEPLDETTTGPAVGNTPLEGAEEGDKRRATPLLPVIAGALLLVGGGIVWHIRRR